MDTYELMDKTAIANLLALLHETDSLVPDLKSGTIAHYMSGERSPELTSKLYGNIRLATHSDVIAWIQAYKAAPKLGRRGDGSKQYKHKSVRPSNTPLANKQKSKRK